MNARWPIIALAGVAILAADPALAKTRHKARVQCYDRPASWSLGGAVFNPAPQPNGCAPAVYFGGRYIGQDPDPFIRQQLLRDPATGYGSEFAR